MTFFFVCTAIFFCHSNNLHFYYVWLLTTFCQLCMDQSSLMGDSALVGKCHRNVVLNGISEINGGCKIMVVAVGVNREFFKWYERFITTNDFFNFRPILVSNINDWCNDRELKIYTKGFWDDFNCWGNVLMSFDCTLGKWEQYKYYKSIK